MTEKRVVLEKLNYYIGTIKVTLPQPVGEFQAKKESKSIL